MPALKKVCSICQLLYDGYGNNAYPINEGRCCDSCNGLVIAARINQMNVEKAKTNLQRQTDSQQ